MSLIMLKPSRLFPVGLAFHTADQPDRKEMIAFLPYTLGQQCSNYRNGDRWGVLFPGKDSLVKNHAAIKESV